jgi:hypothetical protein
VLEPLDFGPVERRFNGGSQHLAASMVRQILAGAA